MAKAKRYWKLSVEVVSKPAGQQGFAVLPRRWVVERTFAWLVRWRRLVHDYERFPETHEAFVKWAAKAVMKHVLRAYCLLNGQASTAAPSGRCSPRGITWAEVYGHPRYHLSSAKSGGSAASRRRGSMQR